MKFWCHHQRELKALLATEEREHLQDSRRAYIEKTRLRRDLAESAAATRSAKLTAVEVACQRAQRAGSHIAVAEIFAIIDGKA